MAPAPAEGSAFHIPAEGPFSLPVAWTACGGDADCTVVSLGCCDDTPVNREHATGASAALRESGRPYCPVKTACGPGTSGTWEGERGVCTAGTCRMPAWPTP
jgi:hypothetical protein